MLAELKTSSVRRKWRTNADTTPSLRQDSTCQISVMQASDKPCVELRRPRALVSVPVCDFHTGFRLLMSLNHPLHEGTGRQHSPGPVSAGNWFTLQWSLFSMSTFTASPSRNGASWGAAGLRINPLQTLVQLDGGLSEPPWLSPCRPPAATRCSRSFCIKTRDVGGTKSLRFKPANTSEHHTSSAG